MIKHLKILLLLAIVVFVFHNNGSTQNEISSPYSGFGVGLLTHLTPGVQSSMGGVSYAIQSPLHINFRNPASYVAFDSLSFIADFSISLVSAKLKTSMVTQDATYARPNYILIGLPVTKCWRTSIGVLPFSDMGYTITDSKILDTIGNVNYKYMGEGGIYQLYWGNAFKIAKGLSLGLNLSYVTGNLANNRYVEFSGPYFYNSRIAQSVYIDGIYFSVGAQYFTTINDKHTLGFGLVYENSAYIWARQNILINYYTEGYSSVISHDTVLNVIGKKGNLVLPQTIGGGFTYSLSDKFLMGADVTWENWKNYRLMGEADSMKNSLIASLGFQFTPDPNANQYLKKMSYSFGAKYSTGYLSIRNNAISEFSISAGIKFPLKSFNTKSSLNIFFEYGRMGTLKQNLILQDYFKISANFTLQEKWYQRVKLE